MRQKVIRNDGACMRDRGFVGAHIPAIVADLTTQYAFPKTVAEKAVADLSLARAFTIEPLRPDTLCLKAEVRAEATIAESVSARLSTGMGPVRNVGKAVALFPNSNKTLLIQLSDAQRAAAKMVFENRLTIICGPPGGWQDQRARDACPSRRPGSDYRIGGGGLRACARGHGRPGRNPAPNHHVARPQAPQPPAGPSPRR
jgi:hypothetical protein